MFALVRSTGALARSSRQLFLWREQDERAGPIGLRHVQRLSLLQRAPEDLHPGPSGVRVTKRLTGSFPTCSRVTRWTTRPRDQQGRRAAGANPDFGPHPAGRFRVPRTLKARRHLLPWTKRFSMKLASLMFRHTWLFTFSGKMARRFVPWMPRWMIYNGLNAWGKHRELPEFPKKSFRELYREKNG